MLNNLQIVFFYARHSAKVEEGLESKKARIFSKLGARVVGASARVKEAFTLKNFRIKDNEKHANPSLSDEVWRLDCIWRRGAIDKQSSRKQHLHRGGFPLSTPQECNVQIHASHYKAF
ncbi:hypothetical protein SASPL_136192 [Salvia splendens]|uniref:Uncharacterized protein n=1 Tax=Salvia splendens TaxID=180675 RepID=A0A8X8WZC9_SALSN|nr:hypothetical protein SASPL_136192 [Salvia splendens]